jgi:hypothetical protein
MLEAIRTFFGKLRGVRGERRTVIEQGTLWRCTKCAMIFVTKESGELHGCTEAPTK